MLSSIGTLTYNPSILRNPSKGEREDVVGGTKISSTKLCNSMY